MKELIKQLSSTRAGRWILLGGFLAAYVAFFAILGFLDLKFYSAFVMARSGTLWAALNPINILRYAVTPVGFLIRLVGIMPDILWLMIIFAILGRDGQDPKNA